MLLVCYAMRPSSRNAPLRSWHEISAQLRRQILPVCGLLLVAYVLPEIPLQGTWASLTVWLTETGGWWGLPLLVSSGLLLVATRPDGRGWSRVRECLGFSAILALVLGLMAVSNEFLVKPSFGVPRPHLERLAEAGVLGMSEEAFYALGDASIRSAYLSGQLSPSVCADQGLSPAVSRHWIRHVGYSFPSGHATAAMTTLTFFMGLGLCTLSGWRRRLFWLWIPWGLAVCYTRPLLQVHTPFDVWVGGLQGVLFGWVGVFLAHRWLRRETQRALSMGPIDSHS